MYISEIKWPDDKKESVDLLLEYLLKVVQGINLKLPDYFDEVIHTAKNFLASKISQKEYSRKCDEFWRQIDEKNAATVFDNQDVLYMRLAISVLSADRKINEAGFAIDWFIELLDLLKVDTDIAMRILDEHFNKLKGCAAEPGRSFK